MKKKAKLLKLKLKEAVLVPDKAEKKGPKQKKNNTVGWQDELGTELAKFGLRVKQVGLRSLRFWTTNKWVAMWTSEIAHKSSRVCFNSILPAS